MCKKVFSPFVLIVSLCKAESDIAVTMSSRVLSLRPALLFKCIPLIDSHSSTKHSAWTTAQFSWLPGPFHQVVRIGGWGWRVSCVWAKTEEHETSYSHLSPLPVIWHYDVTWSKCHSFFTKILYVYVLWVFVYWTLSHWTEHSLIASKCLFIFTVLFSRT